MLRHCSKLVGLVFPARHLAALNSICFQESLPANSAPSTSYHTSAPSVLLITQHGTHIARPSATACQWIASRSYAHIPDYTQEIEAINSLFVEARDEIEMAHEESETVYFNESVKSAKEVVDACISRWEALLKSLPENERSKLQRSMGLRMEQLKAEFDQVKNLHLEE